MTTRLFITYSFTKVGENHWKFQPESHRFRVAFLRLAENQRETDGSETDEVTVRIGRNRKLVWSGKRMFTSANLISHIWLRYTYDE